jgi:hypothetical protein
VIASKSDCGRTYVNEVVARAILPRRSHRQKQSAINSHRG